MLRDSFSWPKAAGVLALGVALIVGLGKFIPPSGGQQPDPQEYVSPSTGMKFALIPAGEFTMGRTKTTPDDQTKMRPIVLLDDRPPHNVWIDAFWLDRTEETQKQYAEFAGQDAALTFILFLRQRLFDLMQFA